MDDEFDYPELSAADSLGSRTQSEKMEYFYTEDQKNEVLFEMEAELGQYTKQEQSEKAVSDYLVKEDEGDAKLSDFIFIRTKQKKSKSKKQAKWTEYWGRNFC